MNRAEQIALHRRCQPLDELKRKARKAGRRPRGFSEESKDLSFREHHDWMMQQRHSWIAAHGFPTAHCHQCHGFGGEFDDEVGCYTLPVQHSPNCCIAPETPQIYAGTTYTGAGPGPLGRLP